MKKVQVSTSGKTFAFELWFENGRYFARGEGEEYLIDLQALKNNRFSLIIDGHSHEVGVEVEPEGYTVFTGSRSYRFAVEDYEVARVKKQAGIGLWERPARVSAPMPGLIVSIVCRVGDLVEKDQSLVVMEAMKMENDLKSPVSGKIKSIHVTPGQNVDKGQILVEFEAWKNPEKPVPG